MNTKVVALNTTVFLTGATILIIEVLAVRLLSPYFGNTIFSVSSVISVILAALSLGYYAGGHIADKWPRQSIFYSIIFFSGILVLFVYLANIALMPTIGYSLPIVTGPLITSAILFFIPALFLGTLSPFAITLQKQVAGGAGVGRVSGNVFFWSTLGSIIGSLSAGFILIPRLGVDSILIGSGVFLIVLGLGPLLYIRIPARHRDTMLALALLSSAAALFPMFTRSEGSDILYSDDGLYQKIVVREHLKDGRRIRALWLDNHISGATHPGSADHVFEYSKYYRLLPLFKNDIQDILVLGGGVYTVPRALLAEKDNIRIEVAEIDPALAPLAQQYFELPQDSRLIHSIADGRRLLHDSQRAYDVIFADAFHTIYSIPAHLTTIEFFKLARDHLKENGVLMANFAGRLEDRPNSFPIAALKTFQQVFPNTYVFATENPHDPRKMQNIMVFGVRSDAPIKLETADNDIQRLLEHRVDMSGVDFSDNPILTDNFAPVDYMNAQLFLE